MSVRDRKQRRILTKCWLSDHKLAIEHEDTKCHANQKETKHVITVWQVSLMQRCISSCNVSQSVRLWTFTLTNSVLQHLKSKITHIYRHEGQWIQTMHSCLVCILNRVEIWLSILLFSSIVILCKLHFDVLPTLFSETVLLIKHTLTERKK